MRIGIVTVYDAYNYGSYLQAYAMQKVLERLGHKVTILNCARDKYLPVKRVFTRNVLRQTEKLQRYFSYSKAWKELNIERYKNQQFDAVIIGSDEVWNIKNSGFEHWPEYFGYNLKAKKVIAYAPSCGFATMDEVLQNEACVNGIKQLNAVFARDDNTKKIAEYIRGSECKRVVDPTLLYLDNWEEETKPHSDARRNYLLYYSYNERPVMLSYMQQFAQENNLDIIVVGFKYYWCDKSLIVHPKQFLTLMKHAKYVVTTTFHGSIFATVFKKKFIGVYPIKNPKVSDFLKSISLQKRVYTANMEYEEFKKVLMLEVDYDLIHEKIRKDAKVSMAYLLDELRK